KEQFENWQSVSFHMAPPLLAKPGKDGRVAKMEMGPWMMSALKVMARLKFLRGSWVDVFSRTEERRMERSLIGEYEALIDELLGSLSAEKLDIAVRLASLPEKIRGYGHVKLANVATARAQQRELMDRYQGRVREPAVIPIQVAART